MKFRDSGLPEIILVGLVVGLSVVAARCDSSSPVLPVQKASVGESVQLQTVVPNATWTLIEAGGGTLTDKGLYTAPPCGAGVPGVYHAKASGEGQEQIITLNVTEGVLRVEIICAKRAGATVCEPPVNGAITVKPLEVVQFFAKTTFSCHDEWSPSRPAGF